MMFVVVLIMSLLALVMGSNSAGAWTHTPGTIFCQGSGAGVCNVAFEGFSQWVQDEFLDGYYNTWEKSCVYDHTCTPLANEMQMVPGYSLRSNDWGPLYHFWTSGAEPNHIAYDVIVTDYDHVTFSDHSEIAPIFYYAGQRYGGFAGCTCGNTGLDQYGYWACGCTFDC